MEKELVSVILPNYNGGTFLKKSIESVISQTYRKLELIIIDDASTDNSREIIESFNDERIKTICLSENGHICAALNKGVSVARGEFIARIDSDDIWEKEKLEKQIKVLEEDLEVGACFTYVKLINREGEIVNEQYREVYNLFRPVFKTQKEWLHFFVFSGNCLSHPSVVIRKQVLDQVGKYNLALVQGQDYELWMRIALKYNLYVLSEELVRYRWMPNDEKSISTSTELNDTRFYNEYLMSVYRFFQNISDEDFVKYFKELFIMQEAKSPMELLCEKAFLCLKFDHTKRLYPIGIEMLERIFAKDEGANLLKEKYNFTPKDFYRINSQHLFYDNFIRKESEEYEKKIENLKQEINRSIIEAEQRIRAEYESTKSWRITAPVRYGVNKCKNFKENLLPPKFYLLGTEDYGNLGDHAIAIAERSFLKKFFPKIEVVEIPVSQYYSKKDELYLKIRKKDIILGHGGGNIGNQYPVAEEIRRDIIKTWPENMIIIFPQTIYFTPQLENMEAEVEKTQMIYNAHKKLVLFTREQRSYKFAKDNLYNCDVYLVPDMVLFSEKRKRIQRQEKIVLCLRNDIERILSDREEQAINLIAHSLTEDVCYVDTQKQYNIPVDGRERYVDEFLELLSSSKLIVTDRMHGMIFAAITGTPCLVLDNYNSKIRGCYKWIRELPYISFVDSLGNLEESMRKLYLYEEKGEYSVKKLDKYYSFLAEIIKKEL
ncbi:polysaccharide pyruvyl transferase family protein [Lachnospiraceae bacterium DSM 108991]|uniref:Polysaccharide pyruvyl transferase family protein n=1 Tax=Claveliimonas monacensis TaxID=2779351 RepID=A0ABR9RJ02_9FIRM|nr:polysaccharide pyruvyl transferase family protein [Claveliimonas monacensis]MBE5062939.1 polysaccharide pyruvyl transferase family protein [Claveliimonas monacensis]